MFAPNTIGIAPPVKLNDGVVFGLKVGVLGGLKLNPSDGVVLGGVRPKVKHGDVLAVVDLKLKSLFVEAVVKFGVAAICEFV